MAIYEFTYVPRKHVLAEQGVVEERVPISIDADTPRGYADQDAEAKTRILADQDNTDFTEDVKFTLMPALTKQDAALAHYFSDIEIPGRNRVKKLKVRVSGGEKSILFWQDLKNKSGRIELPVMSINRASFEFNPQKFSQSYVPVNMTYTNVEGSRAKLTYRPYPALINYELSLWAERKDHAEYALYQIILRFHGGLAEFKTDFGTIVGSTILSFNGWNDASDVDQSPEELAKVRYDLSITAESWIPLPEKLVPTILGRVQTVEDVDGTPYFTQHGIQVVDSEGE